MLYWIIRVVMAVILLQTLYFKFTGSEESKYIFSELGAEPWGRIGSGVVELIISLLLLLPGTVAYGAAGAVAVMGGALLSHLAVLGIDIKGDGGLLFYLALTVFVGGVVLLFRYGKDLPVVGRFFA